jgi:hypothetical protein
LTARRTFLKATGALGATAAAWPLPQALAATDPARVALVIGCDAYPHSPLGNAVNDSRAIAALAREAGFTVDLRTDLDRGALAGAIAEFAARAARPGVGLAFFYYAGHGAQIDWNNYLIPVDGAVQAPAEVESRCVPLRALLDPLTRAKERSFLIVLDACRDNPFGRGFRPLQQGLSQFDAPVGSMIAFSTAPGQIAADGDGRHSLYTGHLLRELSVRGARIEEALKRVRLNVRLDSQGKQVPWESTSLEREVFLFPAAAKPTPEEVERQIEAEVAAWRRVRDSQRIDDWVAFLREFPYGRLSEVAQARLDALLGAEHPGARPLKVSLGPGLPVPDFYGVSSGPNSAGLYPSGRGFAVGDEATFNEHDAISKALVRTITTRVTAVDVAADRVEFNRGALVTDLRGNWLKRRDAEWDAPVPGIPTEYYVGRSWRAAFVRTDAYGRSIADYAYRIVARELVAVPAGTFDAFRVEGSGRNSRGVAATVTYWIVPRLNYSPKFIWIWRRGGNVIYTEHLELVAARQQGG